MESRGIPLFCTNCFDEPANVLAFGSVVRGSDLPQLEASLDRLQRPSAQVGDLGFCIPGDGIEDHEPDG